jgi:hypothetical protein
VHENRMAQMRQSGFVLDDTALTITALPGMLCMAGDIVCLRGIVVRVYKVLEILRGDGDDAVVQTVRYAYNAFVRGHGTFLRFDNAHAHPGHDDEHHRHDGDWRTGKETDPVWVGPGGWPTLGDFLSLVEDWYCQHCDELPEP